MKQVLVNLRLRSACASESLMGALWVAKGRRKTKTMIRPCACADPESFVRGGPTLTTFFFFFFFFLS